MPIIVACPNCSGRLRVADDLIGRKVRCPACSATFDAMEPPPPEPAPPLPAVTGPGSPPARDLSLDIPVETQQVDPWKQLNLELTPDSPQQSAPPPVGLKGAIEIESSGTERQPPPPERDREERRPRLNDDHDDLRPCPECGRMNYHDARWCSSCDVRLEDEEEDEDRPRRGPVRRSRRDSEPHRGAFILTMGILSLAVTPLFICVWIAPLLGLVGLAFGLIAWILGQKDLPRLRDGTMDPEGYNSTQAGWICGIIGTCLNAFVVLTCGGILGALWYSETQRSRNMNRPPFTAPPPVQPPFKQ